MNKKNPRNWWQQIIDRIICSVRWLQFAIQDRVLLWWGRKHWQPKKNPLISIIIPTRDRWELLKKRAIPSIIAQTYKNWELIIIDDGSEYAPISYYHYLLEGVPKNVDEKIGIYRIEKKFHYPKNAWCRWAAGPVRALNFALSKVKGDYLLRIDDDDELYPQTLECLLSDIKFLNVELVSAQHITNGIKVKPHKIGSKHVGGIQTCLMRSYLKYFKYNKDCWRKKWNGLNDIDLLTRMVAAGIDAFWIPEPVLQIRPRPGQTEIGWKQQLNEYNSPEKI